MIRYGTLLLLSAFTLAPAEPVPGHGRFVEGGRAALLATDRTKPFIPAAELARSHNAAIPLASVALVSAPPFILAASAEDRARAIDCLAAAAYYEAGRDARDQRAVVQVVLNRVRHAVFPATICGVVFAGADRPTGCQFTFTCDGSLARRRPSSRDWEDARETAAKMLLGRVEPAVGQATHYHTDWVSPPWNRTMDKLAVVGPHLFFHWRGIAGSPAAFTQRHAGTEPRIPQLAGLSAAHGNHALIAQVPSAVPEAPEKMLSPASRTGLFLVVIPADAPETFQRLAEERCAGLAECRFIGWTDRGRQAQAMPLSGTAVDAISFTFVRRPGAPDHALWNCAEFARNIREECLLRGI